MGPRLYIVRDENGCSAQFGGSIRQLRLDHADAIDIKRVPMKPEHRKNFIPILAALNEFGIVDTIAATAGILSRSCRNLPRET